MGGVEREGCGDAVRRAGGPAPSEEFEDGSKKNRTTFFSLKFCFVTFPSASHRPPPSLPTHHPTTTQPHPSFSPPPHLPPLPSSYISPRKRFRFPPFSRSLDFRIIFFHENHPPFSTEFLQEVSARSLFSAGVSLPPCLSRVSFQFSAGSEGPGSGREEERD